MDDFVAEPQARHDQADGFHACCDETSLSSSSRGARRRWLAGSSFPAGTSKIAADGMTVLAARQPMLVECRNRGSAQMTNYLQ
jgi:hypothetical protein